MKKLLFMSGLLNLVLIGCILFLTREKQGRPPISEAAVVTAAAQPALAPKEDVPTEAARQVEVPDDVVRGWHQIESTDFYEYMDNLRKIGCPEETIADIIISEVSELYRQRLAALPAVPKREYKFWQTGPTQLYPRLDPALEKARRDIETERDELLRTLLGANFATYKVPRGAAEKWMYDPFFAALPVGRRNLLFDINDRYLAAVQKITDHRQSYMDADDYNELNRLREQRDAEYAAVLDADELQQFKERLSDEAELVRKWILPRFDASETEFRAIVSVRGRRLNSEQTERELKTALGEERYAQYRMAAGSKR